MTERTTIATDGTVIRHLPGCSCGAPDCPQWQADQAATSLEDFLAAQKGSEK